MVIMDLERKVADLERRIELTETRLSQLDGRFEFISGQPRDIQLYLHAKFGDVERQMENMEASLRSEIQAVPHAVAEMLAERG